MIFATGISAGTFADAQRAVATQIKLPPGYYVTWSGQFEYLERAKARLQVVVPVTILIIFLLLYLNFRRVTFYRARRARTRLRLGPTRPAAQP